MKYSRIVRGFGFGSGMASVADLKPGCMSFDHNWPFHSKKPDGLR
jgi:hypothetical protein